MASKRDFGRPAGLTAGLFLLDGARGLPRSVLAFLVVLCFGLSPGLIEGVSTRWAFLFLAAYGSAV